MNASAGVNGEGAGPQGAPEGTGELTDHGHGSLAAANGAGGATGLGLGFANGVGVSAVATDLLDAADKHVPTLSLNARRKFFHALAVVMFLPGVLLDVRPRFLLRAG
jgi:hypothetical protein